MHFDDPGDDEFLKNILWTDECSFGSDGKVNRHNEHHYAVENPHCHKEIHIQGRWTLNVWMGILGNQVIGPEFIEGNINGQYYANFITNRLNELLEDVPLANRINIIFQQDGHPAHTSRQARRNLDQKFPGRWIGLYGPQEWPPRSPDLSPLDFFLWGYLQGRVYQNLPVDRENLKARIRAACANITPQMLHDVRNNLMKRIAMCAEENGGLIEHLL